MLSKIRSLVVVACILLVFGCSSSGGGSDDPDNPESPESPESPDTPVNPGGETASLIGTWEFDETQNILADDDTTVIGSDRHYWKLIFKSDGSFFINAEENEIYPDYPEDNDNDYNAGKGQYTATGNYLTLYEEFEAESDEPFTTDIPWFAANDQDGVDYAIIGGKLYLGILSRSGAGSGIEGVWRMNYSELDEDDFDFDDDVDEIVLKRETLTIDANEIQFDISIKVDGDWVVDPDESWSGSYEIIDDDSIDIVDDEGHMYRSAYFVTDTYLFIGDRMYPPFTKK